MPIPDPDKIWPKLEQLGVKEVRKLLSMGVYAKHKIPVIEEWLRRKEAESITRFDRYISCAKNHPVISVILIIGLIVIALAKFKLKYLQLGDAKTPKNEFIIIFIA